MFDDSPYCFASCNLPINPLRSGVEWPIGNPNKVVIIDSSLVTDEMQSIIDSIGLNLERMLLWTWNENINGNTYVIHSDGHVGDPTQRHCALNWHIQGDSHVDWLSYDGATIKDRTIKSEKRLTLTEWEYNNSIPKEIARWTGRTPALLNIRQPHRVSVFGNTTRKAVTMRFLPNIDMAEFIKRLGSRIIKVNQE